MAPSDANGVYSLPSGYLAVDGTTIQPSQHNPSLEDIAESMTLRMMRSGVTPMSGPLKASDGTVGAPGLTFNSATSSGFYKTADGWGLSIGGVQVAEFTSGGIRTGARYLGELIPFSGLTAPPLTVLCYGQTLSRTTYAALWAFAQTEIAAGSTFYNNGNGSTTFGIGDLRGRVVAGKDNMGGSAASRLTTVVSGVDGATMGAAGGAQSHTLTLTHLPTGITSSNLASIALNVTSTTNDYLRGPLSAQTSGGLVGAATSGVVTSTGTIPIGDADVTSNNTSGGAHNNVQSTIVANYLLFAGA